jgi:hypothetical protein
VTANRPHPADAQVKLIIFSHRKSGIEYPNFIEDAAAEEGGGDHFDKVTLQ